MSQFTNTAVYIKRAETHHDEEYIKNAFKRNLYGIVKNVTFVQKTNESGQKYNGVLVVMEHWFKSQSVNNLFEAISEQKNKEYKMFHNTQNRYWIVIRYTNTVNENSIVNLNVPANLDSAERIRQLELMVNSMSVQMSQLQKTQQQNEDKIVQYEHNQNHNDLLICELRSQIEEKDFNNKCLEEEIDETNCERTKLIHKLISLRENIEKDDLLNTEYLVQMDKNKNMLQELNDFRNMICYYEQLNNNDPSK